MKIKAPFWNYSDLAIFLGLILPSMAVTLLVSLLLQFAPKPVVLMGAQTALYATLFGSLVFVLKRRYDRPVWQELGCVESPVPHWKAILAGFSVAVGLSALGALLRTPEVTDPMKKLLDGNLALAVVGVAATTIMPLCEELAFRGFILPLFAHTFGVAPGILLTSIPFALLHGPQYEWHWQHMLLLTMAGAAFGWMRAWSGSTISSSVMHGAYNLTFLLGYIANQKELSGTW